MLAVATLRAAALLLYNACTSTPGVQGAGEALMGIGLATASVDYGATGASGVALKVSGHELKARGEAQSQAKTADARAFKGPDESQSKRAE